MHSTPFRRNRHELAEPGGCIPRVRAHRVRRGRPRRRGVLDGDRAVPGVDLRGPVRRDDAGLGGAGLGGRPAWLMTSAPDMLLYAGAVLLLLLLRLVVPV